MHPSYSCGSNVSVRRTAGTGQVRPSVHRIAPLQAAIRPTVASSAMQPAPGFQLATCVGQAQITGAEFARPLLIRCLKKGDNHGRLPARRSGIFNARGQLPPGGGD
jgi:hypothetical protein